MGRSGSAASAGAANPINATNSNGDEEHDQPTDGGHHATCSLSSGFAVSACGRVERRKKIGVRGQVDADLVDVAIDIAHHELPGPLCTPPGRQAGERALVADAGGDSQHPETVACGVLVLDPPHERGGHEVRDVHAENVRGVL